ncbi:MAG TPA: nuclear transport factor 2 family protein [Burkholderiales bacterium]|jgi:ketosteroid isomerase-like protein|nr:nuclear transport factor 2 family protein [Burkholderiales bacterium]
MRTKFLSLLVVVLTLLTGMQMVRAQSGDDAAVAQAVESLRKAALDKDQKQFAALLSDQLSYGHSAGRLENKAVFIAGATKPNYRWKSIDLTDHTNKVVGNIAIVRHNMAGESETDGKSNSVKIGVLMIWQKEQGTWRLLARQAYRL